MTKPSPHEVTQLLQAWSDGNQEALDKLVPLVYEELHRLARHYLSGERPGHTLQTTELVNEAYMRLVDWKNVRWQNRAHFFGVAAQMMRRILVDFARSRHYAKRGREARQVSLAEAAVVSAERGEEFVALDDALESLAAIDARNKSQSQNGALKQSNAQKMRGLAMSGRLFHLTMQSSAMKHDSDGDLRAVKESAYIQSDHKNRSNPRGWRRDQLPHCGT